MVTEVSTAHMDHTPVSGCSGQSLLQGGWLATIWIQGVVLILTMTTALPMVSAQQKTTIAHTTNFYQRTTPVYRMAGTTGAIPTVIRKGTTVFHVAGSTNAVVTPTRMVVSSLKPPAVGTAVTQAITPIPTQQVVTTPRMVSVKGNLTGSNICPRSVIETRYVWKNLKFECDRKEYVRCPLCPGCRFWNSTHCIHELRGECTAHVYQYEPVTVSIQQCCDGYEQMGTVCIESVQCQDNNGGCPHICRSNKQAGRHCECFQGFQHRGSKCEDFDECTLKNGGCSDDCVNTVGSYYCKCNGTRQLASPFNCENVDGCKTNNGGCDHTCKRRDGTHYCDCNQGFQLKDGRECIDVDECEFNPCRFKCENRIGTYRCKCPLGEILKPDNSSCIRPGVVNSGPVSRSTADLLSSPAFIGTTSAVGGLLVLVNCVWVICCYVKGTCCCQTEKREAERRRRQKRHDVQAIVVQYSNRDAKENGHVNPGYVNDTPPAYVSEAQQEYDTNARMPNGMHGKEEMAAAIHIIPDLGQSGGGLAHSEASVQNGRNVRRGVPLPGLT